MKHRRSSTLGPGEIAAAALPVPAPKLRRSSSAHQRGSFELPSSFPAAGFEEPEENVDWAKLYRETPSAFYTKCITVVGNWDRQDYREKQKSEINLRLQINAWLMERMGRTNRVEQEEYDDDPDETSPVAEACERSLSLGLDDETGTDDWPLPTCVVDECRRAFPDRGSIAAHAHGLSSSLPARLHSSEGLTHRL